MSDGSGPTSPVSSENADPVLSAPKMSPDLSPSTTGKRSTKSSRRWPASGIWSGGALHALVTSEHRTNAGASGFWPTPTVKGNYAVAGQTEKGGDGLVTAVKMWPTPNAGGFNEAEDFASCQKRKDALDAKLGNSLGMPLGMAVRQWSTPQARDHKGIPSEGFCEASLPRDVANRTTPRAEDAEQCGTSERHDPLNRQVQRHPGENVGGGEMLMKWTTRNRVLNPAWVEALMGWPLGFIAGLRPEAIGLLVKVSPSTRGNPQESSRDVENSTEPDSSKR